MALYRVTLEGREIGNYADLIADMQKKFRFPRDCQGNVERYLDWMRDLSWIEADEIQIDIKNAAFFMQNCPKDRREALSDFEEIIIRFWKYEADKYIVGGRRRNFTLNLLDE